MKQEDWTQDLRQRLADHEEAAPEGLWTDIEGALERQRKRPTLLVRLRRWAVAAAVVGIVAGGSYLLWPDLENDHTATNMLALNLQQPSTTEEERGYPPQEELTPDEGLPLESRPANTERPRQKAWQTLTAMSEEPPAQEESTAHEESSAKEETSAQEERISKEETRQQEQLPLTPSHEKALTPSCQKSVRPANRVTFQLYASNYSEERTHSNEVLMSPQLAQKFTNTENLSAARSSAPIYLLGYEERQHHQQPVSVGLTLSYQLARRLSLSTGVVYTWQQSEFFNILPTTQISTEQKLYYLGIPLSLHYQLWQHRRLSLYLSAGAQADFNVSSKLTTDGVSQTAPKDHCQWSAAGSLGIAYQVLPEFSLYVEPGAKHYFDNGSQVDNFFKDQPTSFSLQLGLRVHF